MTKCKQYDMEYKVQAVKLAHEIGGQRAAEELGIPKNSCADPQPGEQLRQAGEQNQKQDKAPQKEQEQKMER